MGGDAGGLGGLGGAGGGLGLSWRWYDTPTML